MVNVQFVSSDIDAGTCKNVSKNSSSFIKEWTLIEDSQCEPQCFLSLFPLASMESSVIICLITVIAVGVSVVKAEDI